MGINTTLKADIDGVETELYPKTQANNVFTEDRNTLPTKLEEIAGNIEEVNFSLSNEKLCSANFSLLMVQESIEDRYLVADTITKDLFFIKDSVISSTGGSCFDIYFENGTSYENVTECVVPAFNDFRLVIKEDAEHRGTVPDDANAVRTFVNSLVVRDKAIVESLSEIDALKSDLGYVKNVTVTEKYSTNLYNEANAEVGYRCVGGGATTTAENSVLSEYIAIPDGMTYAVPSAYYNGRYRVFCYSYGFADESKNPIAGSGGHQTSAISIPDGAKYFRCSWLTTTTEQRFINFNTDGSLFPYEEYYEPIYEVKTSEKVEEKLENHESRISTLEHLNNVTPVERVICWGDSLTDGSGASGTNHQYPFVLKSLINANNTGIVTDSAGQGGEGTYSIATRQGGVVVNVKPCTIPARGSVNVEIDKWNGLTISLCRRGGKDVTTDNAKMKINPCYIAGVKGTLLRDSNSKYVFTRAESGDEVTFDRPVPLLTYGRENLNGENEVAVIWSGTNDIASNGGTIEKTIQGINMMIAKLKSKKYIVVGLTSKAYHSDIDDKNFRMAMEYKDHFVNVRDYMLSYGLDDYGITPTEQDLTDISNGEIPSSLRVDGVHGNDYFYDIVAKQVYKKGQELGYWN